MGFNLFSLMSYPLWTLLSALFFPLVAAIATFVCLRRARLARKMLGFFLTVPILVILIVVFFSDTGSIMTDLLSSIGIPYPPVVGFLSSITLGIFCLNLTAMICGAGLFKKSGAILNTTFSLIFFAANVFVTYNTWTRYVDYAASDAVRKDGGIFYVKEALPYINFDFIPDYILESGVELIVLAIFALFLIVYFLTFIALKSPEEIAKEDLERRRRAALMSSAKKKPHSSKRASKEDFEDENPECCACCEHATLLKGDKFKMVCDKYGVVVSTHKCKSFLYDPLKRTAIRPKISPLSEDISDLSGEDHI
jgi:hypothetical protein